jgi:hypothetical protein
VISTTNTDKGVTMSTTTDVPHLAAMATTADDAAPEVKVPVSDVTKAYLIGYADAEVAALWTIDDVRELSDRMFTERRAGTMGDRELYHQLEVVRRAHLALSAAVVVEGCPE